MKNLAIKSGAAKFYPRNQSNAPKEDVQINNFLVGYGFLEKFANLIAEEVSNSHNIR